MVKKFDDKMKKFDEPFRHNTGVWQIDRHAVILPQHILQSIAW